MVLRAGCALERARREPLCVGYARTRASNAYSSKCLCINLSCYADSCSFQQSFHPGARDTPNKRGFLFDGTGRLGGARVIRGAADDVSNTILVTYLRLGSGRSSRSHAVMMMLLAITATDGFLQGTRWRALPLAGPYCYSPFQHSNVPVINTTGTRTLPYRALCACAQLPNLEVSHKGVHAAWHAASPLLKVTVAGSTRPA
jgi:hypothetical protein